MRSLAKLVAGTAAVALAVLFAGCSSDPDPMPAACVGSPDTLLRAIGDAPAAVALADGTRLSQCISSARGDGDQQSLGVAFTRLADTLRARAATDAQAALRLGYLNGAVTVGATNAASGIADQLARRIKQLATLADDAPVAAAAAYRRGLRAGVASG